jgi:hypothetical protein
MPSRELQKPSPDGLVAPAWESTPWQAEERVVAEVQSSEPPLQLSDEHVIELTESESLRRAS